MACHRIVPGADFHHRLSAFPSAVPFIFVIMSVWLGIGLYWLAKDVSGPRNRQLAHRFSQSPSVHADALNGLTERRVTILTFCTGIPILTQCPDSTGSAS